VFCTGSLSSVTRSSAVTLSLRCATKLTRSERAEEKEAVCFRILHSDLLLCVLLKWVQFPYITRFVGMLDALIVQIYA